MKTDAAIRALNEAAWAALMAARLDNPTLLPDLRVITSETDRLVDNLPGNLE